MKRASIRTLTVAIACAGTAACADTDDGLGDVGSLHRAAGETVEFWNFRLSEPDNGPVQLHDDDGPSVPETIIWDIDGGEDVADVYDDDGGLLLTSIENQIFDATGSLQCTAYFEDGLYKLRDGLDGAVIYTATPGRYVFAGDVPGGLPAAGTAEWQALIYGQLDFEFYGEFIYDGPRWAADIVGVASTKIHRANPMRKLLFAALYGGACGSPGPEPSDPPPG
jgi:hypothetical protein